MITLARILLRLFPRAFREQFGREVLVQVARDHRRARARGVLPALWSIVATSADLLRAAVAERLRPTWVAAPPSPRRGSPMTWTLTEWARDLRLAGRTLRRSPGFTVVAIGTLGLAIGANAGMFSVVDAVLLRPLPFAHPDRLVYVAATAPGSDFPEEFGVSSEFFVQYREQSKLLENVTVFNGFTSTLRVGDRVERVPMSAPTRTVYATLGVRPILGRLPEESDGDRVAVISDNLWRTWFGQDSSVIGRTYFIGNEQRTVIGVMGPSFHFPDDRTLLWIPSVITADSITPGRFGWGLVGRMGPGVTTEAVARELTALARRLPQRFGGSAAYGRLIEKHRARRAPRFDR